jgi:hypothetical protein
VRFLPNFPSFLPVLSSPPSVVLTLSMYQLRTLSAERRLGSAAREGQFLFVLFLLFSSFPCFILTISSHSHFQTAGR